MKPMTKELKKLINAAIKASSKCQWGSYPMAPAWGLPDKEVRKHHPASLAHHEAAKALKEAGFNEEASHHSMRADRHDWVTTRVGCR